MAKPVMTNNSPEDGHISWEAFNIQYEGAGYAVPAGSTSDRWVWWVFNNGAPAVVTGNDLPIDTFTQDDLILFGNKNGTAIRIQSSSLIDGELLVDGTVMAKALHAEAITADHLLATNALIEGLLQVKETVSEAVSTNGLYVGPNMSITEGEGFVVHTPLGDMVIPADGQAPVFTGSATFDAFTAKGNLKIEGITNELAKGAIFRLATGTSAPKSPPAGSAVWPSKPIHEGFTPKGFARHTATGKYYHTESIFSAVVTVTIEQADEFVFDGQLNVSGTTDNGYGAWGRSEIQNAEGGVTIIDNSIFVLCQTNEAHGFPYSGRAKWFVYHGTWNPTTSKWEYVGRQEHTPENGLGGHSLKKPAIGMSGDGRYVVVQCNTSGEAIITFHPASVNEADPVDHAWYYLRVENGGVWSPGRDFTGVGYASVDGLSRIFVAADSEIARVFHPDTRNHIPGEIFNMPTSEPKGFMWDGSKGIFRSRSATTVYDHSSIMDTSITAVMTWRKEDQVAPDYAQYETDKSKPWITTSFPRRAQLLLNAGSIPDDITDPDDPDSVSFYVSLGDVSANAVYKRQALPAKGYASKIYKTLTATGDIPPAAANFPKESPSRIVSDDNEIIDLRGNGAWRLGDISGDDEGRVYGGAFVPICGMIPFVGLAVDVPVGWRICDGGTFLESAFPIAADRLIRAGAPFTGTAPNRTVTLPNMPDRFVSGSGPARALYSYGGTDTVTMPDHQHPITKHGTASGEPTDVASGTARVRLRVATFEDHNHGGSTGNVSGTNPPIPNVPKYFAANQIMRLA